jgi:uncharacterized protein (DUF2147 family)
MPPVRPAFALLLFIASTLAYAEPLATGHWTQIDDDDGKPRSIIRIEEHNGVFEGHIEQIIPRPDDDPRHLCRKCTDTRKDQPIVGMKIINGLTHTGLGYSGGEIVDPESGNVYRAKMTLSSDGNTLEVRGYIGISLFGRSQTWFRAER